MPPPLTLTVGAEAVLNNATPTLIAALEKQLTIDNPQYKDAQKYGRWMGKRLKPHLYFYEKQGDAICFPRRPGNRG